MALNLDTVISETERKLGHPPRRFGFWDRIYLNPGPLLWRCWRWFSNHPDPLIVIYEWRKFLLREGEVALGVLVQANIDLFSPGKDDLPALVAYSSDRTNPDLLAALGACADRIFSLKGTHPTDPEERTFAEAVTDEYRRNMRLAVPKDIAGVDGVTLTTVVVFRNHLPNEYLTNGFFPLLIHRETSATMIVPAKYWPDVILRAWEESEEALGGAEEGTERNILKARLIGLVITVASTAIIYFYWRQLLHKGSYSVMMALVGPFFWIVGLFILLFPEIGQTPNPSRLTSGEKIFGVMAFVVAIVAALINWYLMDTSFFGR